MRTENMENKCSMTLWVSIVYHLCMNMDTTHTLLQSEWVDSICIKIPLPLAELVKVFEL